jgi:hypothetical protein
LDKFFQVCKTWEEGVMKYVKPSMLFAISLITFGWAYNVGHNEFDPGWWDRLFNADVVEAQAGWLLGLRPGIAFGGALVIAAVLWVLLPMTYHATRRALSSKGKRSERAEAKAKA